MRFKIILSFLWISLLLTGCSKDFDDIFEGRHKNVFEPIDLFVSDINSRPSDQFYVDYINTLVSSVLSVSEETVPHLADVHEAFATVINDNHLLKDAVALSGRAYSWPEIDFSKYSLVLGWYVGGGSGFYIEKQRIQLRRKKATLYLEIKRDRTHAYTHAITGYFFAALYPKFEGSVTVLTNWEK